LEQQRGLSAPVRARAFKPRTDAHKTRRILRACELGRKLGRFRAGYQFSSSNRCTAGQVGFFVFTQSVDRPRSRHQGGPERRRRPEGAAGCNRLDPALHNLRGLVLCCLVGRWPTQKLPSHVRVAECPFRALSTSSSPQANLSITKDVTRRLDRRRNDTPVKRVHLVPQPNEHLEWHKDFSKLTAIRIGSSPAQWQSSCSAVISSIVWMRIDRPSW
jgi:hypothetical protein